MTDPYGTNGIFYLHIHGWFFNGNDAINGLWKGQPISHRIHMVYILPTLLYAKLVDKYTILMDPMSI